MHPNALKSLKEKVNALNALIAKESTALPDSINKVAPNIIKPGAPPKDAPKIIKAAKGGGGMHPNALKGLINKAKAL